MIKYRDLKEDITQISVLEENASAEAQLLQVQSRKVRLTLGNYLSNFCYL